MARTKNMAVMDAVAASGTTRVNGARRVVIAEDNAEHQRAIVEALSRLRPGWQVCAVETSREGLLRAVEEFVPNLLILDVHLVGGTSVNVDEQIDYEVPVIFVTADPAMAAEAWEKDAVDYVLKPIKAARLERAFAKLERLDAQGVPGLERGELRWFSASRGGETVIIRDHEVMYFQSELKFTRVVTAEGAALIKRGLGSIEPQLDPASFFRIHRGTVINIRYADALTRDDLGRLKLQIKGRPEWLFVSKPFEKVFRSN